MSKKNHDNIDPRDEDKMELFASETTDTVMDHNMDNELIEEIKEETELKRDDIRTAEQAMAYLSAQDRYFDPSEHASLEINTTLGSGISIWGAETEYFPTRNENGVPTVIPSGLSKTRLCTEAIFSVNNVTKPIVLGDASFTQGVNLIMAGPGMGKSSVLRGIKYLAAERSTHSGDVKMLSFFEPFEDFEEVDKVIYQPCELIRELAESLIDPGTTTLIVDSMSLFVMANWNAFATTTGGINPGIFYLMTALDAVAHATHTKLIFSLNTNVNDDATAQRIFDFAMGRVSTVMWLKELGSGVYTSRLKGNGRNVIDVSVPKFDVDSNVDEEHTIPAKDDEVGHIGVDFVDHTKLNLKQLNNK